MSVIDEFRSTPVNLRVHGQRTSMRLDPATLEALDEMAVAEGMTRHAIADLVADRLPAKTSLACALRAFVLAYWMHRARTER